MNPHRQKVAVEETAYFMPYEPVIRVRGGDLVFISGATALPLYHQHPHEHDRLDPPDDIHATAAYRAQLVRVLTGRALLRALEQARS